MKPAAAHPVVLKLEDLSNFVPTPEASELVCVTAGDKLCFPLHQQILDGDLWHEDDMAQVELRVDASPDDPDATRAVTEVYADSEVAVMLVGLSTTTASALQRMRQVISGLRESAERAGLASDSSRIQGL